MCFLSKGTVKVLLQDSSLPSPRYLTRFPEPAVIFLWKLAWQFIQALKFVRFIDIKPHGYINQTSYHIFLSTSSSFMFFNQLSPITAVHVHMNVSTKVWGIHYQYCKMLSSRQGMAVVHIWYQSSHTYMNKSLVRSSKTLAVLSILCLKFYNKLVLFSS